MNRGAEKEGVEKSDDTKELYSRATRELEEYTGQVRKFLHKPGVVPGDIHLLGEHVRVIFNSYSGNGRDFKLQFLIYLLRCEDKNNSIAYQRRIILPGEEPEELLHPKEVLILSEIFPTAYRWADSIGITANMDYDLWKTGTPHKISLTLKGLFERSKWSGVLDLVKTVDDLIDELTSSKH